MNKNVGGADRAVRIIAGVVIVAWGVVTGSWLGVIGAIPLATGLIGWCPLYCPFGIKTCSEEACQK